MDLRDWIRFLGNPGTQKFPTPTGGGILGPTHPPCQRANFSFRGHRRQRGEPAPQSKFPFAPPHPPPPPTVEPCLSSYTFPLFCRSHSFSTDDSVPVHSAHATPSPSARPVPTSRSTQHNSCRQCSRAAGPLQGQKINNCAVVRCGRPVVRSDMYMAAAVCPSGPFEKPKSQS